MRDVGRILTAAGYERLKAELEYLRTVRRHEVAEKLKDGREVGVWDSPDQMAAREEQSFIEGRIATLERLLYDAEVIKVAADVAHAAVNIGTTAVVRDEEGEQESYSIVGAMEAEPAKGRISHQSPVAQALLGHSPGDTVEVQTPMGTRRLTIIAITDGQTAEGDPLSDVSDQPTAVR